MEAWLDPVLDAEEMRAVDAWAISDQGIPSLDLMEVAGRSLAEIAEGEIREGPARVVCGKGNNGGDGLVAARWLSEMGHEAEALLLGDPEELSEDARTNFSRCPSARRVEAGQLPEALAGSGVIIDAIFGTGFEGAPRAPTDKAIEAINNASAPVVAADIASGVNASNGEVEGVAVEAEVTVTFHAGKIGHWIYPGKAHAGRLEVADIGIPEGAPLPVHAGLITADALRLPPPRTTGSTKFDGGRVVIVGGSRGLTGSVAMVAEAAIRSGAGYATVAVPAEIQHVYEIKLTEVMSIAIPSREGHLRPAAEGAVLEATEGADAVVLGPGMSKNSGAAQLAQEASMRISSPLVLDADGLNAHAGSLAALAGREAPTVITPHAGEMARLLGTESHIVQTKRLACAEGAAKSSRGVVLLKGDDSIVADGRKVAINPLSSPALATAGTGDVLSGMIGALIGRGMDPFAATCTAVFAHSRAGLDAAGRIGPESVIATDVIESIPAGLRP